MCVGFSTILIITSLVLIKVLFALRRGRSIKRVQVGGTVIICLTSNMIIGSYAGLNIYHETGKFCLCVGLYRNQEWYRR